MILYQTLCDLILLIVDVDSQWSMATLEPFFPGDL